MLLDCNAGENVAALHQEEQQVWSRLLQIALAHCGKVILESSRLESRRCETHYSCALRPPCRRPLPLLQVQCMGESAVGVGGGGGGGGRGL